MIEKIHYIKYFVIMQPKVLINFQPVPSLLNAEGNKILGINKE